MKTAVAFVCAFALLVTPAAAAAQGDGGRTITRVVKLLEDMLQTSKDDGNRERELYAKYKCYCDTNEAEKNSEIESLTEEISILESKIEELQASTGVLSKEVAQLDADKASNMDSQNTATTVRGKENGAFIALEADLTAAIGQMDQAIQTLADIGADQSLGESAADHKYMMAGHENSLLAKKLHRSVTQALLAASAFVEPKQSKVVESFLQAPFTATYTAQSGEVVGILKDMRDTFKANLATATDAEAKALTAYNKLMKNLRDAYDEMDTAHTTKQGELGDNDGELSSAKTQLKNAVKSKGEAELFLEQLLEMCEEKAKEYKNRVMMRTNEEAAVAEAISILNSDAAFATFGGVDATKTGSTGPGQIANFVQISRHIQKAQKAPVSDAAVRKQAQDFLAPAAKTDSRLSSVLSLLQMANPFKTVLEEIEKMLGLIKEEGEQDAEQLAWCTKERTDNGKEKGIKEGERDTLIGQIDALNTTINDPVTGLKFQIETAETDLEENIENQKTTTAERTEENLAYQKDVANLVDAEALLEKAIAVLTKYYDQILPPSSLLQKGAQPAPPPTFEGNYQGQSSDGNGAISMLEFILSETKKEETTAHDDERIAQHTYEDDIQGLKTAQAGLVKSIAQLKETLAEKEEEKLAKEEDLKATLEAIAAIEAYLLKIKPGCDFITENKDKRDTARATETAALKKAQGLIEKTPAYMTAEAVAHNETLGDCKDICAEMTEDHVKCKACLADTSIPGYCAGHEGTLGC